MYSQYFRKPIFKLVFVVWFFLIFFLLSPKTVLADKTWDGGGGADSNWNTCTNWTTDVCPASDQTTDIAIFNATSSNNVTISSSITAKGISIASGYGGIITQNNSFTMTLGASGFSQATATFLGGNSAIDVNGDFVISGGAFTSTSGTVTISGNFTKTNSPTFTHNSGTVTFDGATFADTTISASGVTFNLVIIRQVKL